MTEIWDEARVQQYIDDGIEESLNLDYKAAGALEKTDRKRKEITKDVSAMANSDGGIIIYGVSEDDNNRHLPGQIDPVDRSDFSKEWLDTVISNIRPNIEGLVIHPVSVSGKQSDAIYVVEIPQSQTAHQALDKKYYKRVGFKSRPMEDYELRDVMNRRQHPRIELTFRILRRIISREYDMIQQELEVNMSNQGRVYAQYIVALVYAPCEFIVEDVPQRNFAPFGLQGPEDYCQFICENSIVDGNGAISYQPILPGIGKGFPKFKLSNDYDLAASEKNSLVWAAFADNAPTTYGTIAISEIEVVELDMEHNH